MAAYPIITPKPTHKVVLGFIFPEQDESSAVTAVALRTIERESLTPIPRFISSSVKEKFVCEKEIEFCALQKNLHLWSERNQKEKLPSSVIDEIQMQILKLASIGNRNDLISILDLISQETNSESLSFFDSALEALLMDRSCKTLSKYFELENLILTPYGIAVIINFLEAKNQFPKHLFRCVGSRHIPKIIKEVAMSPTDRSYRGCVIYNSFQKDTHVSPVFIKKKGDKIQILVTDSAGQITYDSEEGIITGCLAFRELINFLNTNADIFPQSFEVYTLNTARQRGRGACSIFSLLDLNNIFKRLEERDIFDFIKVNGILTKIEKDFNPKLQVFRFDNLPPDMMEETQSLSLLNRYETSSPTFRAFSPVLDENSLKQEKIKLDQSVKDLHEIVDCSSRINAGGKLENRLMDRRRMETITRICKEVLKIQ